MRGACVLNRIRIKFTKGQEVKYISHLDTMRVFERTVRREGIPIAYSQGFNPRPQMSFGLPLSVGVTSDSEYVDFDLEGNLSVEEIVQRLNNNLPGGFRAVSAEYVNTNISLMASIGAASYEISLQLRGNIGNDQFGKCIGQFMHRDIIEAEKQTKSGLKKIDIRPYIHEIEIIELNENTVKLKMLLGAGSENNLKPELVIKALEEECRADFYIREIHRTGLFGKGISKL